MTKVQFVMLIYAEFSPERFITNTSYQGFVTKSQLLEKLFTWDYPAKLDMT